MCHPSHDYAHLMPDLETDAMTTTPATCQLATPARHGRDGRPYTTCGTLVNPAGYCCECGTRCARRMPDDTYQAACGAELREQHDDDLPGHSHHVTTCDLAPGHDDDHLGAILDPDTAQLTGEVVSWPDGLQPDGHTRTCGAYCHPDSLADAADCSCPCHVDDGLAQHIDLHPQPVDGCKVCASWVAAQVHPFDEPPFGWRVNDANPSGAMIPDDRARCATCDAERWEHADRMADLACATCGHTDDHISPRDGCDSCYPSGPCSAAPAPHDYWACTDLACATCHGLDDPKPRDTNGHPSDSPGGTVGTRSLASALAAYPPVDSALAATVARMRLQAR